MVVNSNVLDFPFEVMSSCTENSTFGRSMHMLSFSRDSSVNEISWLSKGNACKFMTLMAVARNSKPISSKNGEPPASFLNFCVTPYAFFIMSPINLKRHELAYSRTRHSNSAKLANQMSGFHKLR